MERKGLRRWMYPLCSHKSNQSGREGGRAQPLKEWHRLCCPVMSNSLQPHGLQHPRPLVPHHLPGFAQAHVHCIGDAIQSSHPLIPSSPSALSVFHHQGLFQWVSCLHQMTKYWSFSFSIILPMSIQTWFPLRLTGLIFLLSRRLSGVFLSTIVRKHQFFCVLPFLWSNSHNCMWPLGIHSHDYADLCPQNNVSAFQHTV